MKIIPSPTKEELQDFLAVIARTRSLKAFECDIDLADNLLNGWNYLFYSDDELYPLILCNFTWIEKKRIPYFNFATTEFCQAKDILTIFKNGRKFISMNFKRGIKIYTQQKSVAKIAIRMGAKPTKIENEYYLKL